MSATTEAFVRQLAELSTTLATILEEHLRDNFGEVLPHVFLGDVTRYMMATKQAAESANSFAVRRELKSILDAMERAYATGDSEVVSVPSLL